VQTFARKTVEVIKTYLRGMVRDGYKGRKGIKARKK
jgi:hypothetical protein